jgi:hypothetical protein
MLRCLPRYDAVAVYDGADAGAPRLARLSGFQSLLQQPPLVARSGAMFIALLTDASVGNRGFDAVFSSSAESRRTEPPAAPTAAPTAPEQAQQARCSGMRVVKSDAGVVEDWGSGQYTERKFCSWSIRPLATPPVIRRHCSVAAQRSALHHTATMLQHTAARCSPVQRDAARCNAMQPGATRCSPMQRDAGDSAAVQRVRDGARL